MTAPTSTTVPLTATPQAAAWTLSASLANGGTFARGSSVQVNARALASQNATAIVDVEIYDQTWHKVYQRTWDNQAFTVRTRRAHSRRPGPCPAVPHPGSTP